MGKKKTDHRQQVLRYSNLLCLYHWLLLTQKCIFNALNGCCMHDICNQSGTEMHKISAAIFSITTMHQDFGQCIMANRVLKKYTCAKVAYITGNDS